MSLFNNIVNYLPYTKIRGINKYYTEQQNTNYCKISSFIYDDDMKSIDGNNTIKYYLYEDIYYAVVNNKIVYKLRQVDDYLHLSIHDKVEELDNVIDVDMMSKYKILKSRGCEDMIENYAKDNTKSLLLKTFKNYFKPDTLFDILYLYIYLHSNCFLLGYEKLPTNQKFNMNKLPKNTLLQEIYDMYNVLYVHVDLL